MGRWPDGCLKTARLAVVLTVVAAASAGATPPDPAVRVPPAPAGGAARAPTAADLDSLRAYIRASWATLTRTLGDLPAAAADPKFPAPRGPWPVYVAPGEELPALTRRLRAALAPADLARIQLRALTAAQVAGGPVPPGLIYLPRPYVVPGGRFNEMYGWDSYFIVLGLLRDGQVDRAKDMVDDAIYQVVHFGKVLNANRTYYLGRSQPPFLTAMIRAVHETTHDRAWLARALPAVRRQYRYWTKAAHRAGATGLSRYHALGSGPAIEVVASERDAAGRTHYDRVAAALREAAAAVGQPAPEAAGGGADGLDRARLYDRRRDRLTPLFYVADRSTRESGFDPSDRFGRFGLGVLDYAPACLNSLLHVMERDLADFLDQLGQGAEATRWRRLAAARAERIRTLLWDAEHGLFADHDFVHGGTRFYPFATAFFPLWAGVASPQQARRTAEVALGLLQQPGGLATSARVSGSQWDAPFAWAPLQLIAVEGLRRYGLDREADQVALAFLRTVLDQFVEHGTVFEKYDARTGRADVAPGLRFGYTSNEIGFGWTNAVFLELSAGLGPDAARRILQRRPAP